MAEVLEEAWAHPFSTRCDFARKHAEAVAIATSHGLISTAVDGSGLHGGTWRITLFGMKHLEQIR